MPRTVPVANGRLHVNFDQLYRVRDIYHRHLGLNNQTGGVPWRLGVWVDGALSWVQDEGWRRELRYEAHDSSVTEARLTHEGLGVEIVAGDAVAPDAEVLVRRFRVTNRSDRERDVRLFLNSRFRVEDNADSVMASALDHEGPVLLQFIFTTCPTICPVMSGTFAATQDKFLAASKDVRMVSISIDPEHDTPERLRDYARKFKAGRQWLFLTGDPDDIAAVQKAFDAYRGNNKMLHEPLTFLRASRVKPWVRLDGLLSGKQLLAEFKQLVSE